MAPADQPTFTLVTLLCMFCLSSGWSPEIQGREGGAVELDCSLAVPGPGGPGAGPASHHVVEWVRRDFDVAVLMSFGPYNSRAHPKYEGRVSLVRSTSLRVERLAVEDEGEYECHLLLLDHAANVSRDGKWTRLSVTAPPTFTKTPPSVMEALVGSQLSLSCVATGNPRPFITWLKDGARLQSSGVQIQGATLLLGIVTPELRGQYGCRASNPDGSITHVTTLQVKGPPVIVVPPKSTSLNMSQDAHLKCEAIADPPNMTYVWRKGRENVHHIESLKSRVKIMVDGSLHISALIPEDSGKYTCMPTNGLLAPPTASADLTVLHPALALPMPRETYLPTGMRGLITCPFLANPPLLHVDWTKDGTPLDATLFPGWTLTSEGSLSMATVNEDSAGVYTCAPANSLGSMGPSGATRVLLQGPPLFRRAPGLEYQREAGTALLIPCQGDGGPDTRAIWRKVIEGPRDPSFLVTENGSLLLRPLTKEHQGVWECSLSNRVASVSAPTRVLVLGTTPHAATSLVVAPGPGSADVSWEPGYDGGSAQTFSVWFKPISPLNSNSRLSFGPNAQKKQQHPGWFNVSVPPASGSHHQVTGLSPATQYQFSVLGQNAAGAGPFSELVSVRILDVPPARRAALSPPGDLSVNLTSAGVVLRWTPPPVSRPPITALVLQSRGENGQWLTVDRDIDANAGSVAVPGLRKDRAYELRLLSRRGEVLSEPGPSVNVSALGPGIVPATPHLSESVPRPLLAGILGGAVFMGLLLFLLLAAACFVARRRDRRRRKQQNKEDLVRAIYKCPPMRTAGSSSSPDSVLKKSLLRTHNLYPTTSSTSSSTSSTSSSSSCSRLPSGYFSKGSPPDDQDQQMELLPLSLHPHHHHHHHQHHQHLLPNQPASPRKWSLPTKAAASLNSSHLELISRGPDGRFTAPADGQSLSSVLDDEKMTLRRWGPPPRPTATFQRSASLPSRRGGRAPPYVLSVDLPPCPTPSPAPGHAPARRVRSMTEQNLPSLRGRYPSHGKASDWRRSVATPLAAEEEEEEEELHPGHPYAVVRAAKRSAPPPTSASTLVLQMEHERERGNLSRCLQLAQEREALQWELAKYTLERGGGADEVDHGGGRHVSLGAGPGEGHVWQHKRASVDAYCPRPPQGSRGSCDLTPSLHATRWGALSPPPGPPTLAPPRGGSLRGSMAQFPVVQLPAKQEPAGGRSGDRFTLPHLSAERRHPPRRDEEWEVSLRRKHAAIHRDNDASPGAERRRHRSSPSPSSLSVQERKHASRSDAAVSVVASQGPGGPRPHRRDQTSVEMSVDGPDPEGTGAAARHALASSLRRQPRGHRGSEGLIHLPGHRGHRGSEGLIHLPGHGRHLWTTTSLGADPVEYHRRSLSLDRRKHRQAKFLTPDAWVDSLSQENCCSTPQDPLLRGPPPQTPEPYAQPPAVRLRPPPPSVLPDPTPLPDRSPSPSASPSGWTAGGEPPSARTPDPDPKRQWSVLSMDALRWQPQPRGSGPPGRDEGPADREEEDPGAPGPPRWPSALRDPSQPPCNVNDDDNGARRDEENGEVIEGGVANDAGGAANEAEEVRGYAVAPGAATRGSFSSYASSGRGSMETANGRMSVCLSPTLSQSPDEIEEYAEDHLDDARRRRKVSVDEGYEWDEDASQPPTRQEQLRDPDATQELLKSASRCSLVSVQACALTDCGQAALLRGCGTNRCSPQVEMETVLF